MDQTLTRIQRALQIEAERGYPNLQGAQYLFGDFLATSLAQLPPPHFTAQQRGLWQQLGNVYRRYRDLTPEERSRLIKDTQQLLLAPPVKVEVAKPQGLAAPLDSLKGIGPKSADQLAKLGLYTVAHILRYYPRDYVDYSQQTTIKKAQVGETVTLMAKIRKVHCFTSPRNNKLTILDLVVGDGTGQMHIGQFFMGAHFAKPAWQAQLKKNYPQGATVALSGLVKQGKQGLTLDKPQIEVLSLAGEVQSETIGRIVAIYPLTEGVSTQLVRHAVQESLPWATSWREYFPATWLKELGLPVLHQAIQQVHLPADQEQLRAARKRLVFEEFFFLQLGLLERRHQRRVQQQASMIQIKSTEGSLLQRFYQILPFTLTGAQQRVIAEILRDLGAPAPMNRLVQGDVGSGKTVVAVCALLAVLEAGYQVALMAPTEVLAEQHYRKLVEWLALLHQPVELLTGSTKSVRRREILRQLATGELGILVGTHALIEDAVQFQQLGLVIIDEQHRFGVAQRARLQQKGQAPHVLTMTATPIPRTLALTLYGDLDVSEIDELPPGRQPIQTSVISPKERIPTQRLIEREIQAGHQIYVVLPLIEESEKIDLKSAFEEHQRLQTLYPQFRVGLLHGKMSSTEKDQVIGQFRQRDLDILVSTTVIEVGVDVPNASVMIIEHAERFGLAQLHQLRGRVGRGAAQSYCLLINHTRSEEAQQRLQVLVNFQDGFSIAEMDLRLRGPGTVLGTRQSGLPDLALASLSEDQETLQLARQWAEQLMAQDPYLKHHPALAKELEQRTQEKLAPVTMS